MPDANLLFSSPWYYAPPFAVGGLYLLWMGLREGAKFGYFVGMGACAFATLNYSIAFVSMDAHGIASRSVFGRNQIAWADVSSVEVVRFHGKGGSSESLEFTSAGGQSVTLRLSEIGSARGAKLGPMLTRNLPPAMGPQLRPVLDRLGRIQAAGH